LALNHPVNVTQEIDARMFDDWTVNQKNQVETNTFYRYAEKAKVQGSRLQFTFSYETFADRVPTADLPAYNTTLFKLKDTLGYRLTYRSPVELWSKDNWFFQLNWPIAALFGFFVTAMVILSALYLYKSELPVPLPVQPSSVSGIGGWLILIIIHHVVQPIAYISALVALFPTVFHAEEWRNLTQPGHPAFDPHWAPVLLFELLFNAFGLIFSFLLLVLFFLKRTVWPRCYALLFLILFLGACLDTFLAQQLPAARGALAGNTRVFVKIIVAGAIWIPYCFASKRVKATFRY
jgi:hypothetical protein